LELAERAALRVQHCLPKAPNHTPKNADDVVDARGENRAGSLGRGLEREGLRIRLHVPRILEKTRARGLKEIDVAMEVVVRLFHLRDKVVKAGGEAHDLQHSVLKIERNDKRRNHSSLIQVTLTVKSTALGRRPQPQFHCNI
jgi:hypothetical protein